MHTGVYWPHHPADYRASVFAWNPAWPGGWRITINIFQRFPYKMQETAKWSLSKLFLSSRPSLRYLNIQEFYSAQKSHWWASHLGWHTSSTPCKCGIAPVQGSHKGKRTISLESQDQQSSPTPSEASPVWWLSSFHLSPLHLSPECLLQVGSSVNNIGCVFSAWLPCTPQQFIYIVNDF